MLTSTEKELWTEWADALEMDRSTFIRKMVHYGAICMGLVDEKSSSQDGPSKVLEAAQKMGKLDIVKVP